MGIPGLTTYINNRRKLFFKNKVTLDSKPLIVDGSALMWQLMRNGPGREYGGDYDMQHDYLDSFFKKVKQMNIEIFILMDGGSNVLLKLETTISRRRKQVERVARFNHEGWGYGGDYGELPLPLFIQAQFKEVLNANGIRFAICEEEADLFVASICNQKNGIAVTNDSDFFLFDIKHGVITLTDFLDSINHKKQNTPLYEYQHLVAYLKIAVHFLPYLALVLGNDYNDTQILAKLSIRIGIPPGKCYIDEKIEKIVKYFKKRSFKSDEYTLRELCGDDRAMMEQLRKEIDEYRVDRLLDSSRVLLESLDNPKSMAEITRKDNRTGLLAFLTDLLRVGMLETHVLDILKYRVHFLNVQIECIDRRTPSLFSGVIRKQLYSILLKGTTDQANSRSVEMKEFFRRGRDITCKTTAITPSSQSLFELLDQPMDARRLFILRVIESACLNKNLEEMLKGIKGSALFLLALKYLKQVSDVSEYQMEAFLVMHVFCKRDTTSNLFDHPPELDFPLLHCFNSFHGVFYYLTTMNTLLGNPFDALGTKYLMSGSKFLHIHQCLLRDKRYERQMTNEEIDGLKTMQRFIDRPASASPSKPHGDTSTSVDPRQSKKEFSESASYQGDRSSQSSSSTSSSTSKRHVGVAKQPSKVANDKTNKSLSTTTKTTTRRSNYTNNNNTNNRSSSNSNNRSSSNTNNRSSTNTYNRSSSNTNNRSSSNTNNRSSSNTNNRSSSNTNNRSSSNTNNRSSSNTNNRSSSNTNNRSSSNTNNRSSTNTYNRSSSNTNNRSSSNTNNRSSSNTNNRSNTNTNNRSNSNNPRKNKVKQTTASSTNTTTTNRFSSLQLSDDSDCED